MARSGIAARAIVRTRSGSGCASSRQCASGSGIAPVDGLAETRGVAGECETGVQARRRGGARRAHETVEKADGRWFRTLTVLDMFTREALALVAARSLTGVKVAAALTPIVGGRGARAAITVDNGGEFVSRAMDGGRTRTRYGSSSFGRASRWKMRSSKASTGDSATNA
jgi:transposase InsO family protein